MSEEILSPVSRAANSRGWLANLCRTFVLARLRRIESGALVLREGDRFHRFGSAKPGRPAPEIRVLDPRFWESLAIGGSLGGAEAWIEGWWDSEDLAAVIRLLARERSTVRSLNGGPARLAAPAHRWLHRRRSNSRRGSRKNIAAHYDLGNDFFASFLDPTMTYSSARFESSSQALEQAQLAKYERLCDRLRLDSQHRVLEIGGGWGGFALYAAKTRGCHVTTTTISKEQYGWAKERIRAAGLAHRVDVLLEDYRDLTGSFDRIVSIEMIEAVGYENFETYFGSCSRRLAPDGSMAIQAILHRDQDFERSLRTVDFIKRYIFPGGQLPSIGAIVEATKGSSDLRMTQLEDLTPHYGETLRRWRKRLHDEWPKLRRSGLTESFLRMWDFYFAFCEGGFDERVIGVAHIVFEKPASGLTELPGS